MSIINDALKKARRNAVVSPLEDDPLEDVTIHPKMRSSQPNMKFLFIPILLLLTVFMAVSVGLGYFVYKEYFHGLEKETQPEEPTLPSPAITEVEPLPPAVREMEKQPMEQTIPDPETASLSPREILDKIQINGIMRGGNHPRILTSTGVYRVGDMLRNPEGYQLIDIEESSLRVKSPDGEELVIDLP